MAKNVFAYMCVSVQFGLFSLYQFSIQNIYKSINVHQHLLIRFDHSSRAGSRGSRGGRDYRSIHSNGYQGPHRGNVSTYSPRSHLVESVIYFTSEVNVLNMAVAENGSPYKYPAPPANRKRCKICEKFAYFHQPILLCCKCENVFHGTCLKLKNCIISDLQRTNWNCIGCAVIITENVNLAVH